MAEKKILAILGSPHTNGMTAAMLDYAVRSAEKKGYTVIKINLYEKNISFCTGCRACVNTKTCIQKDDIQEIVVHLQECQSVFLAVPFSWIFGQSRWAIRNMDEFFRAAGMKPMGKIVCAGAADKKELPKRISRRIERCLK